MSTTTQAGSRAIPAPGKYLTFYLGEVAYGLEILRVKELIGVQKITALPQAPAYVKGVINLRDTVIPIVELRGRFGMESVETDEQTCIVVVQVEARTVGLLVDRVSEVLDMAGGELEGPPSLCDDADGRFIRGISKAGGRVTLLLDIDRVVGAAADVATEPEPEALAV